MQTKFNVGDKVWQAEKKGKFIQSLTIKELIINENGIFCSCLSQGGVKKSVQEDNLFLSPLDALAYLDSDDQPES